MQSSQPTLEPHSLCYTCWVQVVYSLLPTLLFFLLGILYCCSVPTDAREFAQRYQDYRGLLGVCLPVDVPVVPSFREASFMFYASAYSVSDIFVINVINNIRIRFDISFYVICAVIYCSLCCIYMWLDPGTYMIARFMSFYKPGVTL